MSLPPGFLDELRDRVSLADVAGRKVTWDRRKSNPAKGDWWAPCPFHQEKTPSFHVDDRKGFYYCFGCHAKGDAIGFAMETENLDFMEAVRHLAGLAGMEVPRGDPGERARADARDRLVSLMEAAARFYALQLRGAKAAGARDYLARRGIDEAAERRFGLGYAPESRSALFRHLSDGGASAEDLELCGLVIRPEEGGAPFDRFRGRIMFPIRDARGRCIAFGGRSLDPQARAKYLNSPETPLFDKSRTLYNHGPAREAAGKAGALIVAEGYMDVIALAQAGFEHAVAPLGTAITEDQLGLLWRIADEPVLALDGDKAGLRAAMRLIDVALPLLTPGKSLRFCLLPEGRDPDDVIRDSGAAAMAQMLENSQPMVELLWRRETEGKSFDSPERRTALDANLRAAIGRIADPGLKSHYRAALAERRAELFRPRAAPGRSAPMGGARPQAGRGGGGFGGRFGGRRGWPPPRPTAPAEETRSSALAGAAAQAAEARVRETAILTGLLNHPELAERHEDALSATRFLNHDLEEIRTALLSALPGFLDGGDGASDRCGTTEDFRAAIARSLGSDPEEVLARTRLVSVARAFAADAPIERADAGVEEALARHSAILAAAEEVRDAERRLQEETGEAVTWRIAAAAAAKERSARPGSGESGAEDDRRRELEDRLQSFIDGEVWVKRKRRKTPPNH